jgi:Protein of Unknown function (DUF2784)
MSFALLADAVLLVHALFIAWVVLGGFAVLRRGVLAVLHLPAVAWGVWVSYSGTLCPLTPLEQSLRRAAGQAGWEGGFIEHYLGALIYPEGLTVERLMLQGAIVLAINFVLYAIAALRVVISRRHQETPR